MKRLSGPVGAIVLALVGATYPGAARSQDATHLPSSDRSVDVALQDYLAAYASASVWGPAPASLPANLPVRTPPSRPAIPPDSLTAVVKQYCVVCHNDVMLTGNLTLSNFDVARAPELALTAEKMIIKLRAGMMPLPGAPRPSPDTLLALVETLETLIDEAAAEAPNPGHRTFQRLNRAEYAASIKDLLALDVDAGAYLPLDTKSANFDNIADVQLLSPTLMNAYLGAASEISRLSVGNPNAAATEATFKVSRWETQTERVEGAPFGTRGGISVVHNFPADGEYLFRVSLHHETTGALYGSGRAALHTAEAPEQIEISVDGVRVAVLDIDRWMHRSDPDGTNLRTGRIPVRAGPHRVTAAFVRRFEGPLQDLVSPHEWSLASTSIADAYGFTSLPHLRDLAITGPHNPTGVSDTPSRREIFSCRPTSAAEEKRCAEEIVTRLATKAYRRSLDPDDVSDLMAFYEVGAREGGFEIGIRTALEAIVVSPHFVFRFEEPPGGEAPGQDYRISDEDLAARLSFFLWGTLPDEALLAAARRGELSDIEGLVEHARRMLAAPRSQALGKRFAAQWLRLQDLEKIHPDVRLYPDFDQRLKDAMRRETELFFNSLVREDRSLFDLFTADYTFVNERLARHYGIPAVTGSNFRRVELADRGRRGLLGHGSVLTLTSHAGRTSPVLRGKWVMEVLLGTPPPPPPPDVPDLEQTEGSQGGRLLTTRERMELHRANPVCNSCHKFMDPIGLALDNFDVTGRWRIRENGMPLDTRGELYDGTPVTSPDDLRRALLARPIPLVRTFTENLMAYALGRRIEYYDKPSVRAIAREAEASGYRISSFVVGIVKSPAFRMSRAAALAQEGSGDREGASNE